jgi:hypothetical protein
MLPQWLIKMGNKIRYIYIYIYTHDSLNVSLALWKTFDIKLKHQKLNRKLTLYIIIFIVKMPKLAPTSVHSPLFLSFAWLVCFQCKKLKNMPKAWRWGVFLCFLLSSLCLPCLWTIVILAFFTSTTPPTLHSCSEIGVIILIFSQHCCFPHVCLVCVIVVLAFFMFTWTTKHTTPCPPFIFKS